MKVLVACEFSGIVRDAFSLNHESWSNDLLETESKGRHIVCDVFEAIAAHSWDLIVMHPPCTALCVSGNRWYGKKMLRHKERLHAIEWTCNLWTYATTVCEKVCMENPVGVLPIKPTQYVQPWQFGHGETKKTGLWLHGLPKLKPTKIVTGRVNAVHQMSPSKDRWKKRSLTYTGIAQAMADQWG